MQDWFEMVLEQQYRVREERTTARRKRREERPEEVARFVRALTGPFD
jgi:hypothetical protein